MPADMRVSKPSALSEVAPNAPQKHVLSFIVENKPGVLQRVVGLVSRRGFNIHALAVGPTDDPRFSRMTMVVIADDLSLEQIRKQLNKLVSVEKVVDITDSCDPDTVITY